MATDLPGPRSPALNAPPSPAARRAVIPRGSCEGAGTRRLMRAGAFVALLLCAGIARAEPQDPALHCLALNVYWEARSGSPEDQRAVAHVTLNRVASPDFPGSVCAVVRQGGEARDRCQFSWRCDGKPDRPENPEAWRKAMGAPGAGRCAFGSDGRRSLFPPRIRPPGLGGPQNPHRADRPSRLLPLRRGGRIVRFGTAGSIICPAPVDAVCNRLH